MQGSLTCGGGDLTVFLLAEQIRFGQARAELLGCDITQGRHLIVRQTTQRREAIRQGDLLRIHPIGHFAIDAKDDHGGIHNRMHNGIVRIQHPVTIGVGTDRPHMCQTVALGGGILEIGLT